jgi:hypothetical protein
MKRMLLFASLAIAAILICLAVQVLAQRSSNSTKEPATETQWEYLVVAGGTVNISSAGVDSRMRKQPDDSFPREAYALERNFDKLGAKGWELVAVSGPVNDPVFYFKRQKESR